MGGNFSSLKSHTFHQSEAQVTARGGFSQVDDQSTKPRLHQIPSERIITKEGKVKAIDPCNMQLAL